MGEILAFALVQMADQDSVAMGLHSLVTDLLAYLSVSYFCCHVYLTGSLDFTGHLCLTCLFTIFPFEKSLTAQETIDFFVPTFVFPSLQLIHNITIVMSWLFHLVTI